MSKLNRVKLTSEPSLLKIRGAELHAALVPQSVNPVHTKPEHLYLLGTPSVKNFPFKSNVPVIIPMGQLKCATEVMNNTPNRNAMTDQLQSEYMAITSSLLKMGIEFRVLNLSEGDQEIVSWLKANNCQEVSFSAKKSTRWQFFPRDMFVYLEAAKILLANAHIFSLNQQHDTACKIVHTGLGEGGRVLFCEDRMIVGIHPERSKQPAIFNLLRKRGMKIAAVPYGLFYSLSRKNGGERSALYYDTHIDRSASLLKGKDGGFHLLLDPGFRTGQLEAPLPISKSVDAVKRACEKVDVQVHAPKKITIPYATAVVQFNNRQVLASGGDEYLLQTVSDIVGNENVFATGVPITGYPVFTGAGLHCLITENPDPLVFG